MAKKKKLTDEDNMPFGIHSRKKMKDVPADYLTWLYEECQTEWQRRYPEVEQYIEDNWDAIEMGDE